MKILGAWTRNDGNLTILAQVIMIVLFLLPLIWVSHKERTLEETLQDSVSWRYEAQGMALVFLFTLMLGFVRPVATLFAKDKTRVKQTMRVSRIMSIALFLMIMCIRFLL